MADVHALDRMKAELQEQFPGWNIWFVPHTTGHVVWCAQPWPLINSTSAAHLAAEIIQARTEAFAEWPALASVDDYGRAAPGIPRVK